MRKGKFEIEKDKKGEFRFRLKASNGRIIATSEGYKTRKSCINGIYSVMDHAEFSDIYYNGEIIDA